MAWHIIKYVEKVNKRWNNLCVLIGPPRGEIIYRHNKERFRFYKRDWRLVHSLDICQHLRKTSRTYKSIQKITRTPTSSTDTASSPNMVSWRESARSATTSSSQRSVLIITRRMEDAQYTNVSIWQLIRVGAPQHPRFRNRTFFQKSRDLPTPKRNKFSNKWDQGLFLPNHE